MQTHRFKNTRKGPIFGVVLSKGLTGDGLPRDVGPQKAMVGYKEVGDFDLSNPAVQLYALHGILEPVGEKAEKAVKALREAKEKAAKVTESDG